MATKITQIPLNGLSTSPSDFICTDGSLCDAMNVFHEDGGITPVAQTSPELIETLPPNTSVLYNHKINDSSLFVKKDVVSNKYYFEDVNGNRNILDISFYVKGRVRNLTTDQKTFFDISEGQVVDLTQYEQTNHDFDVYVYPSLILNDNDISNEVEEIYYSRKRTGKEEKVNVECSNLINYQGRLNSIKPMTTSKISVDLTTNGEFCMNLSMKYKGVIIVTTFNFKYRVNSGNIPSNITPYTKKSPIDITNVINEFKELNGKNVTSIESLGTIMVLCSEESIFYYKFENGVYKYLGDGIPELDIRFSLEGHFYHNHGSGESGLFDDWNNVSVSSMPTGQIMMIGASEEEKNKVINSLLAEANSFTKNTSKKGYFTQPFLVRYALRLFDGSYTKPSAPVLMTPSTKNPIVSSPYHGSLEYSFLGEGVACKLVYKYDGNDLEDWKDIIESVDIFVTSPFYTFNQDTTEIPSYNYLERNINDIFNQSGESFFMMKGTGKTVHYNNARTTLNDLRKFYGDGKMLKAPFTEVGDTGDYRDSTGYRISQINEIGGRSYCDFYLQDIIYASLDYKSEDKMNKEIKDANAFYLAKSLRLEEIDSSGSWSDVSIDDGILNEIELQESLIEDYDSFHKIIPGEATTYNNRLSIFNIQKKYFEGFELGRMIQDMYQEKNCDIYGEYSENVGKNDFVSVVSINVNGKKKSIANRNKSNVFKVPEIKYIFYPDVNAYNIDFFYMSNNNIMKLSYQLLPHDSINGSFYFSSIVHKQLSPESTEYASLDEVIDDFKDFVVDTISNEIRTSNTGNVFTFMASNIETIGNGNIISLVPQAIALSQGQFGAYPMMCFTTDGIWALSVNNTGGWSAKQPFSRDVVLNEDAGNILQLDRQVMFASDRGLMLINGSNVDCISENFDGQKDSFSLVKATTTVDSDAFKYGSLLSLTDILDTRPEASEDNLFVNFKEFIGNAVFLYDYTHQRIIIGNESYPLAFVYNMKDKAWTTINQRIVSAVNSYPRCYAMTKKNVPLSYSKSQLSGTSQNPYVTLSSNKFIVNVYANSSYTCFAAINKRPNVATSSSDIVPPGTPIWLYSGSYLHLVYAYSNSGEYTIVSEETITAYKEENMLVDFSSTEGEAEDVCLPEDGFVMTRPIKLGDSTALKTIRTINAQGKFDRSHVDMVLLGCNDNAMKNWFVLSSCKGGRLPFKYGTPFKYFRVALLTHLEEGESINSLTIEYEVKETNKLRQ